ncbi:MAG TPA: hypothetical protein VGN00_22865 [Puia sp.]|jgi:hypothetical protein
MFPHKSCTELKATPDYSHFLFTSRGIAGSTTREVRFIQKETDIFNLEIGDFNPDGQSYAGITDNGDIKNVLTTLVMIIELYLEQYPTRVIRLKGNTREKSRLYRLALDMHVDVLNQHFDISMEDDKRDCSPHSRKDFDNIGWLIKRRPCVRFTLHSIQTTRNSRSLLFGKTVSVEIQRSIEIGLITAEC